MIDNNVLNLDAIAEAKVKLTEELRRLEEQEVHLLQQQAAEMFSRVIALLNDFGKHFNGKQKAEIAALIMVNDERPKTRRLCLLTRVVWLCLNIAYPTVVKLGLVAGVSRVHLLHGKVPLLTRNGNPIIRMRGFCISGLKQALYNKLCKEDISRY